jgi:ubiquinone/menaquinone biosynthesis C-methylase UbiE
MIKVMTMVKVHKDKQVTIDDYKREAEVYDQKRFTNFEGMSADRIQTDFLIKKFKQYNCKNILECGCGTGRFLVNLAKKGYEVHGFDTSDEMLSIAKDKAAKNSVDVKLKMGDIENIPYEDDSFDAAFTIHVLMHMPDYQASIKEMHRVVK